jgi:thiamine-phosphate pyrophosphorylase
MELFLISTPDFFLNETDILLELMRMGNFIFHLRKPMATKEETDRFLASFPTGFHQRIVIHQHHFLKDAYGIRGIHLSGKKRAAFTRQEIVNLKKANPTMTISTSLHTLNEVNDACGLFDYVFLSPVFDSISKKGYLANPELIQLKSIYTMIGLKNPPCKVMAMGGITPSKLATVKEAGFDGAAVLGVIWEDAHPLKKMSEFLEIAPQL